LSEASSFSRFARAAVSASEPVLAITFSIVAYKTGTEQTVNLVLNTVKAAMKKEKVTEQLQLHSDQGFQYTSHGYFKLTQLYNITPSMSRKGNPYDNALAENFFSILKTECMVTPTKAAKIR